MLIIEGRYPKCFLSFDLLLVFLLLLGIRERIICRHIALWSNSFQTWKIVNFEVFVVFVVDNTQSTIHLICLQLSTSFFATTVVSLSRSKSLRFDVLFLSLLSSQLVNDVVEILLVSDLVFDHFIFFFELDHLISLCQLHR